MIYFKINKDIYNEVNFNELLAEYPLLHSKALLRSVKRVLYNELKNYPDIDIIINFKNIHTILGRFSVNNLVKHKEYNFIKGNNPYIILFWHSIESYFCRHSIKGLKEVFLHEFLHYTQWLLNEPLKHNKDIIPAIDNPLKVDSNIKRYSEVLNNRGKNDIN